MYNPFKHHLNATKKTCTMRESSSGFMHLVMHFTGCKLCPKDMVPKAARDAESVFKILVMVLHAVLLEVAVKGGEPAKLSAEGLECRVWKITHVL